MSTPVSVRRSYFVEREFRKIRARAVITSLVLHIVVFVGLLFYQHYLAESASTIAQQLLLGGSGGGGGEGADDNIIEFGPQSSTAQERGNDFIYANQFTLLDIRVYNESQLAKPVLKKEEPKTVSTKKRRPKPIIAENLPTRWVRRGTGPGSGGGAGGGSGGGIGAGQGYSIDWGGTGSRRLLSGKLPSYPEGTDKEMAVTLQFTVLPDGLVYNIIPIRKTDELLEGAAISALRTWRFDPLPLQMEQLSQVGKVTFNFRLE